MKRTFHTCSLALGLCLTPGALLAQSPNNAPLGGLAAEAQGADETSALGARQQRIKRLLNDLESKFTELAEKLRQEQPDQAKKLEDAFKQSKELLLMQRMDEITTLLDAARLETATDEQDGVIGDLKELIDLLLYEESEYERLQREMEQLERWKEALDDLIEDESELQEQSEELDDPDAARAELQAQIDQTKALLKAQEALNEATAEAEETDVDAMDSLADEQAELREQTEALAEELSQNASSNPSRQAQQEASQSLSEASQSQQQAENQLAQSDQKGASKSESEAVEQLKEALEALEQEQARQGEGDPQERAEQLAQQQSETAAEARQLGDEMAEAEASPQEGESSPAEGVQNAQQQMNQAAQQLGQNQPGQAAQNQERAREELERAREEVERQLNELRDQAQQEQIARLEEVFKQMLEKQRQVTGATRAIAERRGDDSNRLRRADRLELRKWVNEERSLEEEAQAAEQLLVDDGTSIVFRDVVGYLQQEIKGVADLMEQQKTGPLVQQSHAEIEATLEELVEALKNSGAGQQGAPQQQPPGPQNNGQQPPERQSLFPPLAEIKLLKFTQERINRQTQSFERAQGQAAPEVKAILEQRLLDTTDMQNNLTRMTRQLAAKIQPTATEEDLNAID